MPLVSVIMNIRNGAAFLREALDSVMAQTFTDWELIAWDDCSTDDSAQVIAEYHDTRIRYYLSPEQTPLGKARDNAIRQAKGEWLAFLDQDDIWTPTKLEKQMALAEPHVGIIYGRAVLFYPNGRRRDYDQAHEFMRLPEGDIFSELFRSACFIAMSSAALRRSLVEEVGSIPKWVELTPDYYLYTALARRYAARAVQEVVCQYRVHPGSMTRSNRRRLYEEPLALVERWADQLDPQIVAYRRMTYSTALAYEEMCSLRSAFQGLGRLLTRGSVRWLLSRPFIHALREIRRKVRRPSWEASPAQTQEHGV
jgi:glycosyltransferase involved in cell wall biosynthesis